MSLSGTAYLKHQAIQSIQAMDINIKTQKYTKHMRLTNQLVQLVTVRW